MVSGINNIEQSNFELQFSQQKPYDKEAFKPLNSFAEEDEAIISSQAKMLNELMKFNSGEDNLVDLALAKVMAEFTVEAAVNVINTKKDMMDCILKIGE